MKKIIPAVETIYCDRCDTNCNESKNQAVITILAREQNYMWEYHYAPKKQLDLCDECYRKLCEFLDGTPILE